MNPLYPQASVDLVHLVDRVLFQPDDPDESDDETLQDAPKTVPSPPPSTSSTTAPSLKKREFPFEPQPSSQLSSQPKPSYQARKRARRRQLDYEKHGHVGGYNASVASKSSVPLPTQVDCNTLPAAQGGYIRIPQDMRGRTVDRPLEWFLKEGFELVKFDGSFSIPFIDTNGRVIGAAVKKPTTTQYTRDVNEAAQLLKKACETGNFTADEKNSKRGRGFPAVPYGLSYGKGQPRPMRLKRRASFMRSLLSAECFRNIAHAQSAAYAAFSPDNYKYYFEGMKRVKKLLEELGVPAEDLEPNFPRSVFACISVNFGPRTRTFVHADSKNTAHGMCAITSAGNFDYKLGGHLVLWDLKLVIEFPPGTTILIPSALLLHSNIGVRAHETRYSITQYTAGGIWRWLDDGGRTREDIKATAPEDLVDIMESKVGRREFMLQKFCTLDDLR
ncbi:hypothetical protein VKT23_018417 [Stygiomarasmius scandens]|uniref:Uncharacterized protein n=1 Tax=Marasmiellus scandens TaxID=2682957 RepID=A0ABR1ITA1_9AGAR